MKLPLKAMTRLRACLGPRKLELVCSWCSVVEPGGWIGELMTTMAPASPRNMFTLKVSYMAECP